MSVRPIYPRRRHKEENRLDVETGKSNREENEEKDCLQQFSCCLACTQEYDIVLILPCSHTLCGDCIAAGEGRGSAGPPHHSAGVPVCSVLCPGCRHTVELPCWNWSSATSCLPKHPNLTHACVSGKRSTEGTSDGQLQCVEGDIYCWEGGDMTAQNCLHGSHSASFSVAPVDGVIDLREEEMEQSVFGLRFALDPSSVPPTLHLSNSSLTITHQRQNSSDPTPDNRSVTSKPEDMPALPQVCANVVISQGQYYWEVDVCNSSVYRIGCSFGARFYSLEDTWHPDLGEPFGVMHCVQCYCEPQKGRRGKVFGKVNCKNIKQDCPELDCDDPVLLPGQCCKTCPKGVDDKKQTDSVLDSFEYFHEKGKEKEDDLHKSYNDRSYLSSEEVGAGESRTDFVAVLTGVTDSWLPSSSGVARARFSLTRTSLAFSITYQKMSRPTRIIFLDSDGTTAFEYRVPKGQSDMICGVWKNLAKPLIRQLQSEQMRISMTTSTSRREEVEGKIIKHRALFAETFSSTLTSEEENAGMGGIAMLTLSDTENNLHFILILQGLIKHKDKEPLVVPIRVQLVYRQHILREIRANVTAHDPDFAEVLTDLNSRELFWLSRGQLEIAVATEGQDPRQISGFITGRKSCDTIQSVMSSGDALTPGKTGGVGSAVFYLHDNGTLDYQVQVAGLTSDFLGLTIELKPRRRNKRSVLYDLTPEYDKATGQAQGSWSRLEARHIHMLLQNELFINVATAHSQEGELRGQIKALHYNGLDTPRYDLPTPLAGHFVSPPVRTGASGHAWVSVDKQCHLHYEIVVAGLSKADDLTMNAHLHGLAEIGEIDDSTTTHKRLLTGFYGSQAQGVLKDISVELLQHLDQGTAFIQVSTKMNPRGEIRGRVHVPNNCEFGTRGDMEEAEFDDLFVKDPEELKKDPHTCFFENQHHAHGSRWTPNYDKCFSCSCQKRTVICDPVICPVLTCSRTIQPEDKCCPICDERKEPKDMKALERVDEHLEGCYFEGDQKMHAPGTTWHPFVPPFGYIKCAVCTCKGSSGEVHCEKVTCPVLTCSHPVRRNPSDCCKECPEEDRTSAGLEHSDMMQADGPRHCKFGKNYYQNSDNWHPWVPLVGEMKCINCWCDHGVTKCQRKQCPILTCSNITRREGSCCPECLDSKEEDDLMTKAPDKRRTLRH